MLHDGHNNVPCRQILWRWKSETPEQFAERVLCKDCWEYAQKPKADPNQAYLVPVALPARRKAIPAHRDVLEPSDSLAAIPSGKNRRYSPNLDKRAAEIQAQVDQFARNI